MNKLCHKFTYNISFNTENGTKNAVNCSFKGAINVDIVKMNNNIAGNKTSFKLNFKFMSKIVRKI